MMSAAQSPTTLVSRMEALQCHFTWDLGLQKGSRSKLLRVRDKLEDICTEEGNFWLGHIYNLRGYIQYQLGSSEDAQSLFNKAAKAFQHTRGADSDEGPWLVVNHGNLAWLHHHLGQEAESQAHLSKVDTLMEKYPSPSQGELHPEIYAEKAWTLMEFSNDKRKLAVEYFEKAIKMNPDMVEWNTSCVLTLVKMSRYSSPGRRADILKRMRMAKEQDPENLYLAAECLVARAQIGERVEDEARELAREVLRNPVSSYNGLRPLLWVYVNYVSADEAIELAEEALKKHPGVRYLKVCALVCYKWIIFSMKCRPAKSTIERAISLYEEVISLCPDSSLMRKTELAALYAKSDHGLAKADQIYQELLESDLEPEESQLIYHEYAKHLFSSHKDDKKSLKYHMKAAEIPVESVYRKKSISVLKKKQSGNSDIKEFLSNLQNPESLYLAAEYLEKRAQNGERVEDEARELAREVLRNPVSSSHCLKTLLRVYVNYVSADEAIELAKEALKKHPGVRYLKICASVCYKWKILSMECRPAKSTIERAISLYEEVISLCPDSSLTWKTELADLYAKSGHGLAKADQIYQELLESDLEPDESQLIYNKYAKHVFFNHEDDEKSLKYHMKAAEIPVESVYRKKSISELKKKRSGNSDIREFLSNLQNPESF